MSSYPSRRRQRLASYDYSAPGFYFVTLCIQDRLPLLGKVVCGQMHRSPAGKMVAAVWGEIPDRSPGVELDTLIVMPDHLHAIVSLSGGTYSLSEIVHHLKSRTTAQYALGVRQHGWPPFPGTLWQRGFFDRVIRDEEELNRLREYILQNPMRWSLARE
jgi:REP element-mobilizing transposase RayT